MHTETNGAAPAKRTIVLREGEGTNVEAFGDSILFKLTGEETEGGLTLGLGTTHPGGGPPPHVHKREDELFIVVSGTMSFLSEGEWIEVKPGGVVFTPRGVVHTFRNTGETDSQAWILATPSGFERFFKKCSDVFVEGGEPDMARILAICAEHGIEFAAPA